MTRAPVADPPSPKSHRGAPAIGAAHGTGSTENAPRTRTVALFGTLSRASTGPVPTRSALSATTRSEVCDLDASGRGHHDVLGLQVPVDDAVLLRVCQPGEQALEHADNLGERQLSDQRPERTSFEVLHRDERGAVVLEVLVYGHDARMVQGPPSAGTRGGSAPRRPDSPRGRLRAPSVRRSGLGRSAGRGRQQPSHRDPPRGESRAARLCAEP